jgi:hypothetical protein
MQRPPQPQHPCRQRAVVPVAGAALDDDLAVERVKSMLNAFASVKLAG